MLHAHAFPTLYGEMFAAHNADGALLRLGFTRDGWQDELAREARGEDIVWDAEPDTRIASQMREYFAGERQTFDVPLVPRGTPFQQIVWRELQNVPFGTTISYAQLAARIGSPSACRAVGGANAQNPIAIIIPCHRVIGSNGTLTGYAGGRERKDKLLRLEGALPPQLWLDRQTTDP